MILKNGRPHAVCLQLQRSRRMREALLVTLLVSLAAGFGWLAASWQPVPSLAAVAHIAPSQEISVEVTFEPVSATPSETEVQAEEVRLFDGRPLRAVGTMTMIVTAYSPDARSCGAFADGITASGYSVWTNGMRLAAADTSLLPLGSLISVPGYDGGNVVPVLDRGGAIKGNRLDMLYPTHEAALQWGVQKLTVTVWEYAD